MEIHAALDYLENLLLKTEGFWPFVASFQLHLVTDGAINHRNLSLAYFLLIMRLDSYRYRRERRYK